MGAYPANLEEGHLMKCQRTVSAVLVTLVTSVSLAGCLSENKPAAVKERASSPAPVVESEPTESAPVGSEPSDASSEALPTPTEASTGPTIGDLVSVGDWDVKITKILLDANAQIKMSNQFNDRPKGVYILVTFSATYTGPERTADIQSDLSWSYTTADSQVNDQAYEVTPADDEEWPTQARAGGTVKGQVVFDLPKAQVKGGILTVEGYDENFDTVYADFQM